MQTIACIKGKFGSTEYFQSKIKAGDLISIVGFASEMPEWEEMTADDILQRDIDVNRVITEMVPYVTDDPDHFFSSLVIDIYQGWEDIEFESLEDITGKLPNAYKNAIDNMGFITFPGNQVLIALDGQHRLLSLKIAIKGKMGVPAGIEMRTSWDKKLIPHPEIANEEVSVIFVKHESNAKIRKLFNKINKYAKQTSRSENIIISEDDIYAVIARKLIGDEGSLTAIKRGDYTQDIVNWKSNTLGQRSAHLTTLSSIYTISQTLLKDYGFNTNYLPEEDVVDRCYKIVDGFWKNLLENVIVYNEYMKKILDYNIAAEYRQKNLLFKPVTQMALSHVAYYANKKNIDLKKIAQLLNKIDWSLENKLWQNILVIGSAKKKMMTGKDAIRNAGLIIVYLTMGDLMDPDEKAVVLEIIRNAEDNINAELPMIVS